MVHGLAERMGHRGKRADTEPADHCTRQWSSTPASRRRYRRIIGSLARQACDNRRGSDIERKALGFDTGSVRQPTARDLGPCDRDINDAVLLIEFTQSRGKRGDLRTR